MQALLNDSDAHGLGGADDGVADGLQRDELAAWIGFFHLRAMHNVSVGCARPAPCPRTRLGDLIHVLQRDGASGRMAWLLAARQDSCNGKEGRRHARGRRCGNRRDAPAAFLMKYVAGGFFTTCNSDDGHLLEECMGRKAPDAARTNSKLLSLYAVTNTGSGTSSWRDKWPRRGFVSRAKRQQIWPRMSRAAP